MWLKVIFELKVNLEKNELIPVGSVDYVVELVREVGCKVGAFPSSYLDLPLGAHFKFVAIRNGI